MKKIVKFLSLILSLVVACSCLTGCFVTYDKEKDFRQVAATVKSYTIVNPQAEIEEGEDPDPSDVYTTKEFKFYKYQLANFINSYYESYINAGYTFDELIDSIIESVLTQRIVINTAYAYKEFGLIKWTQYEEEDITAYKYQQVDAYLEQMKALILEERGEEYVGGGISPEDSSSSTSTTYPVYVDDSLVGYEAWSKDQLISECMDLFVPANASDAEKEEYRVKYDALVPNALIKLINDYNKAISYYSDLTSAELRELAQGKVTVSADLSDYEIICLLDNYYYEQKQARNYEVSLIKIPGLFGDDKKRSLENNAMDRVLTEIKSQTDAYTTLTVEEKQKIDDAWAYINQVKITKGISYTYKAFAESYIMEYIAGRTYREEVLVSLLEEYIEAQVGVTRQEVEDKYATILATQIASYDSNINNYIADMESGSMVLYHPVSGYYFVKHILIPFSSKQLESIEKYDGTVYGQNFDNQTEYRNYVATQIMSYEHKDGEDYGDAKSIDEILQEIRSTISEASNKEKDREFTKLMYKYSTDTGGFSQKYGYKEKVSFAEGEKSSFVTEFADACADLYANGKLYELSEPVVTTYGVHILMLTRTTDVAKITAVDDYASASDNRTVYQVLADEIYQSKLSNYFATWQNEEIVLNYVKSVDVKTSVFENIIEEMTK